MEKSRDFSDIELTILQKLLVMFTQLMREPWKNVVEISPVLSRLETNPQFAQVIAPSDMIAIVTLNMKSRGCRRNGKYLSSFLYTGRCDG